MRHLPPIAHDVVVAIIITIETVLLPVLRLALAARGREETFLALATAAHAWRIAWAVDGSKIALHLSAAAGYAGLIDAFVLRLPSNRRGRLRVLATGGARSRARARAIGGICS